LGCFPRISSWAIIVPSLREGVARPGNLELSFLREGVARPGNLELSFLREGVARAGNLELSFLREGVARAGDLELSFLRENDARTGNLGPRLQNFLEFHLIRCQPEMLQTGKFTRHSMLKICKFVKY